MEQYSLLRHLADSWGLLVLFLLFCGVALWPFVRPGRKALYQDASEIPFRHEDKPVPSPADQGRRDHGEPR